MVGSKVDGVDFNLPPWCKDFFISFIKPDTQEAKQTNKPKVGQENHTKVYHNQNVKSSDWEKS